MVRIPIVNVRYVMFHLENYEIFQSARRIALKKIRKKKFAISKAWMMP